MTPRELFGVGVRLLGLWFGYYALTYFVSFCINRFQNISFGLAYDVSPRTWEYLGFFALDGVVAWLFLFRAELIVRLTYGDPEPATEGVPPEKTLGDSI